MTLDAVVEAMSTLGILSSAVARFHREFDSLIVVPRIITTPDGSVPRITVTETEIRAEGRHKNTDALDMIQDIYNIINFLDNTFPESVSSPLLDKILPALILQLVSGWLDPSMPLKLDHLEPFMKITTQVAELSEFIAKKEVDMPSDADLQAWLKRIPQNWLARRKEAALADMRSRFYDAVKIKKTAEKIETQMVDSDDVMYGDNEAEDQEESKEEAKEDDWGENWGDNEEEEQNPTSDVDNPEQKQEEEEEDASAWDVEESSPIEEAKDTAEDGGDEADAWGWGDEENEEESEETKDPVKPQKQQTPASSRKSAVTKKTVKKPPPTKKEVTLRETFTVTSIPDSILDLISQVLDDAATLKSPSFSIPTIAVAAPGLSSIPTLLLAMFRATASTYYTSEAAGQMLIYNDAQHLITLLQTFLSAIPETHPLATRLRLDADIQQLEHFARRSYGREMEAQRTILDDILSSTAGFVNSTAPLNARQYAATVQDAVNRVRDVDASQWQAVLSESVRLQSLGRLVGSLARQMVADVLERADDAVGISEEQSKALKGYCDGIAELADLFNEVGEDGSVRSLVHVYTQDWLRFVYLGEILEASLADIRYLWTEGELSLEFEASEVVDLIQALFADSVHRKEAIREIRATHRGGATSG
jgi:protein transport protein DSL1/ZW10